MSESGLYRVDITEHQQTDWINGLTIGYEWTIYDPVSYTGEWERGIHRGPLALNGEALCITVIESTAAEAKAVALTYVRAMKRVTERAMKATTEDLRAVLRAGLMA